LGASLDDSERISTIDRSGMLKVQMSMPEACISALKLAEEFLEQEKVADYLKEAPSSLVFTGMGGSAIGGELLQDWLLDSSFISIYVSRGYRLPASIDKKSLVFAISYSGDTEETLSSFQDALSKGCRTVALTSGGRLKELSPQHRVPCLTVPVGLAPRASLPYLFFPLALTLSRLAIAWGLKQNLKSLKEDLEAVPKVLKSMRDEIAPEVPQRDNPAKRLASDLLDTMPLIYAPSEYGGVARRMKNQFNENSKVPSYAAVFPEAFHNEVMGYEGSKELFRSLSVILLRDKDEDPRIRIKIEAMKGLIEGKVRTLREVWARGETRLAKIFSTLYLGDVTSVYLAVLYGVDPTPVESISKIKQASTTYL
jgi:glucose/mannose-6-phosphate isomerase